MSPLSCAETTTQVELEESGQIDHFSERVDPRRRVRGVPRLARTYAARIPCPTMTTAHAEKPLPSAVDELWQAVERLAVECDEKPADVLVALLERALREYPR